MRSANFDFMSEHDEWIVTLGGLAERYFRDDPSTTIVKLRQFAELSAKLVAAHHGAYRDGAETCEETLGASRMSGSSLSQSHHRCLRMYTPPIKRVANCRRQADRTNVGVRPCVRAHLRASFFY